MADKEKEQVIDIKSMSVKERIIRMSNELRVGKEGRNTFSNYDYIRPDDLQAELNPYYEKYRLFPKFDVYKTRAGKNKAVLRIEDFDSTTNREVYIMDELDDLSLKGANPVMNAGGLMTYCKRYLQMNAFNIAANEDDLDNNKENTTKSKGNTKISEEDTLRGQLNTACTKKYKSHKDAVDSILKKYDPNGGRTSGIKNTDDLKKAILEIEAI